MNKKGIAMQTLVMAILSLVVLVILIFVFRTQIGNTMEKYTNIADESEKAVKGDTCGALFSDTRCISGSDCSVLGDSWTTESSLKCVNKDKICCKEQKE
ncbi:hypothetical protein CEE44_02475 [Candidatus Woesearchaeota archaeon B3_Woes]|nr:MAG: hypothetical protein CEE44_02475 [Candidatus Woesearchaeota archaeon B3_Woes]